MTETEAQAAERRLLESLDPEHRAALEASIAESHAVAAAVSADLHGIVDSLDPGDGSDGPQVVDEQYRVKALASLSRKFTDALYRDNATTEEFLGQVNDRVRFSVQMPEQTYAHSVDAVLSQLRVAGYEIDHDRDIKNFWQYGNRHNGVNVTVRTPEHFVIEIQFPTKRSREVGKKTHALYERLRLETETPERRVEAFLDILQLNKETGIYTHIPQGLNALTPPVNTTFARWIERNPDIWRRYQNDLTSRGLTFAEAVASRGLGIEDFPGIERSAFVDGGAGVQLSRGIQAGTETRPDQPDGGMGKDGSTLAGHDVEPSRPRLDLRSGDRGQDDLRRPDVRPGVPSGPAGGGAYLTGEPGERIAERGGASPDVRGGRSAGPGLGATNAIASTSSVSGNPSVAEDGLPASQSVEQSGRSDTLQLDDGGSLAAGVDAIDSSVSGLDGDHNETSPVRAAEVLSLLPRPELLDFEPLPMLGSMDYPVRRDNTGLIVEVYADERWMDVPTYLDTLTVRRAGMWRNYAVDNSYPEITKGTARPCISIAIDRRTGVITEGHNNLRVTVGQLHPLLRSRLERYLAESAKREPFDWNSSYFHPSAPGEHAEIFAISELLWARQAAGYVVDEAVMRELRVDNHFPWMKGGRPAPCCGNCTALIPDVPCNAGKLPYFRAPEEERWPE